MALLRQGGLVVIDNVLWSGAVADPERQDADTTALRALNAKLHDDQRISLSLLPVSEDSDPPNSDARSRRIR